MKLTKLNKGYSRNPDNSRKIATLKEIATSLEISDKTVSRKLKYINPVSNWQHNTINFLNTYKELVLNILGNKS